jgi:hypothetical protein
LAPEELAAEWLAALAGFDLAAPSADYLAAQARALGIPSRLALSFFSPNKSAEHFTIMNGGFQWSMSLVL